MDKPLSQRNKQKTSTENTLTEPAQKEHVPTHDGALLSQLEPGSGLPLYEQTISWLLQKVYSGEWPAHHQLPAEVELAKQLNVSRITIRRALGDLTKRGVLIRIVGRGTFVALSHQLDGEQHVQETSSIRRVDSSDGRLIGVLIPFNPAGTFVSPVLSHLEHALYKSGYRMLLADSRNSLKLQTERLQHFASMGVAGVILYSGSFFHDETVKTLANQHIPLVMLDRYYPAIPTHLVTTDHFRSGYLMTEYLLQLGHRQIGFILATTENVTSTLARFEGYKAALQDYGVTFDERLLMRAQVHRETVETYLKRAGKITAVFASNDERAIEFYTALCALGIQVPQDLSLVGCDDIPAVSQLTPPLTTIAQNGHQLGEAAARLLIETIEGQSTVPSTITIPPELVIRQSCLPLSSQQRGQTEENTPESADEATDLQSNEPGQKRREVVSKLVFDSGYLADKKEREVISKKEQKR